MIKLYIDKLYYIGDTIVSHSDNIKTRKHIHHQPRHNLSIKIGKTGIGFAALSALAISAEKTHWELRTTFDMDSYPIGIDNQCSACISYDSEDFIGLLIDTKCTIKGFGSTRTTNVQRGTLLWRWQDNIGQVHKFKIPNSYYVPSGRVCLLSPQH